MKATRTCQTDRLGQSSGGCGVPANLGAPGAAADGAIDAPRGTDGGGTRRGLRHPQPHGFGASADDAALRLAGSPAGRAANLLPSGGADRGAAHGLYRKPIWGQLKQKGVLAMTIERGLRLAAGVVVLLSVSAGLFCPSRLAPVDGLRGAESAAIGLYELVPDGVDSGPPGIPALRRPPNSTNTDQVVEYEVCLSSSLIAERPEEP